MVCVDEVAMTWRGSLDTGTSPPTAKAAADGSVIVTAWTAPPSGMQRTRVMTRRQWTFSPAGAVTVKELESKTVR